jgi:hypothetical protein
VESVYQIHRRSQGDSDWELLGETSFASTPREMANRLGAPLLNQLTLDLRTNKQDRQVDQGPALSEDGVYQSLSTQEFPALALAETYFRGSFGHGAGFP